MKKKEILIVVLILIICGLYLIYDNFIKKDSTYAKVVDLNTNEELLRFDISEDAVYELDVKYGKFHIEVKDAHYHAFDVDCPNQTCVNMGWMPSLGIYSPITCIPNGIMIVVEENE